MSRVLAAALLGTQQLFFELMVCSTGTFLICFFFVYLAIGAHSNVIIVELYLNFDEICFMPRYY
jgi:hypothetical protein